MANAQNLAVLTILLMVTGAIFAVLKSSGSGFDVQNEFFSSGVAHYKNVKMDTQVHANLATNSLEAQLSFKNLGSDWTIQYRAGRSIRFEGDVCDECFKATFPDVAAMSASARCVGTTCSVNGRNMQIELGANGLPKKVIGEDFTYDASVFTNSGSISWSKSLENCQCSDAMPANIDAVREEQADNTFEDRRLESSAMQAPRASYNRGYWRDSSKTAGSSYSKCQYAWKTHCGSTFSIGYGSQWMSFQGSNNLKDWIDNFSVIYSSFNLGGHNRHAHKGITKAYLGVEGKYYVSPYGFTGTSLGGGISHVAGADAGGRMTSYNGPRVFSSDSGNYEHQQHSTWNAERHYMDDDPVSDMPGWGKHYGKGWDLKEKSWFKPCKSKRQGQNNAGEAYKVWHFFNDHKINNCISHHKKNCKVYW